MEWKRKETFESTILNKFAEIESEGKKVTKTALENRCEFGEKRLRKIGLTPLETDKERFENAFNSLKEKGVIVKTDEKVKVGSILGIKRTDNVLELKPEKLSDGKDSQFKKEKILK